MFIFRKIFFLNFGPQHPAAHGVLRLIIELSGETVISIDSHIGLLHRGTEKLMEYNTFISSIPYFDRFDYVSMLAQEHCYILSLELLRNITTPVNVQLSRIMLSEITRILNHLMSVTTHALDIGALTPFLWGFEEREKLFEFYEQLTGARMHTACLIPGSLLTNISSSFLMNLLNFLSKFKHRLFELENLLMHNPIWLERLSGIGILSRKKALNFGYSGVALRACGLTWDLRKVQPYDSYEKLHFKIPKSENGDSLNRFYLRICEMFESVKLIQQCCFELLKTNSSQTLKHSNMEFTINNYLSNNATNTFPHGSAHVSIEAPKGEFGVTLHSTGFQYPNRCKVRPSGLLHLQSLNVLCKGSMLADIPAIIGSLDIVFGEIDR